MSGKRYSDEFKAEAAKQVIDQGRWCGRSRLSWEASNAGLATSLKMQAGGQ
jgi:hypothetical protein